MELYDFNKDAYNKVVELFKFRFYKQIKDTGIVFKEILLSKNLVTKAEFYILICDDQENNHYIRFKDSKLLFIRLRQIAEKRLKKLERFEKELMKLNDTESYGESNYFNDTEMTAIGISTIKELLKHFDNKLK